MMAAEQEESLIHNLKGECEVPIQQVQDTKITPDGRGLSHVALYSGSKDL